MISAAYTLESNGLAERTYQKIMNDVRYCFTQAKNNRKVLELRHTTHS